jgi:hypothetical protein
MPETRRIPRLFFEFREPGGTMERRFFVTAATSFLAFTGVNLGAGGSQTPISKARCAGLSQLPVFKLTLSKYS